MTAEIDETLLVAQPIAGGWHQDWGSCWLKPNTGMVLGTEPSPFSASNFEKVFHNRGFRGIAAT
jgi:hypothetical protein